MTGFTTTKPLTAAGKQPADPGPGSLSICGQCVTLPTSLVLTALRYAGRPEVEPWEIRDVRCTLQAHATGDHYAFVVDTTATTSAWTRWNQSAGPQVVLVLPDCPTTGSETGTVCAEYEFHPGGHTWQIDDPWNPVEPRR
jgi:hypothetical protein